MNTELVSSIVSKALDGLFVRQAATANNIANANSEGFAPSRVSFEDALRDAVASRPGDDSTRVASRIASVVPAITAVPPELSGGIKLDQEIATASETSTRYALLTGMLDRTLQMQMLAVKGA
jgi:flagellar basal-body rod protein FlgB